MFNRNDAVSAVEAVSPNLLTGSSYFLSRAC